MKKYLIPFLLGAGILSLTLVIVAFDHPTNLVNSRFNDEYADEWNYGRMGGAGSMMGGSFYNEGVISTDLTGTDYNETQLKAALDVVLADEYKARAEYEAISAQFDQVTPFEQLIRAETMHIQALIRIYDAYDFAIPADNGASFAVIPTSLESAYQVGIDAETANIAFYETYLNTKLPLSVERVFTNLQNASEQHLSIFTGYATGDVDYDDCPMFDGTTQRRGRNW